MPPSQSDISEVYSGTMIADTLGLVDELTYRNYAYNRNAFPETSPERWAAVYGPLTEAMETRYRSDNQCMYVYESNVPSGEGFQCANLCVVGSNCCARHTEDIS